MLFVLISLIVFSIYSSIIIWVAFKFKKTSPLLFNQNELPPCSVLIPIRNESENIIQLVKLLNEQTKQCNGEIIVIDDYSTDDSYIKLLGLKSLIDFKLIKNNGIGKKEALQTGIERAEHEIIVAIDGDCTPSNNWLIISLQYFVQKELNMLCGLIQLNPNKSLFSQLQAAESAAIVGISAVGLNAKRPTTCNGANLIFKKSVFSKIGGYQQHLHIKSGDDDLLMHAFFQFDSHKVSYFINKEAIVFTDVAKSFKSFVHQRSRWLSKSKSYIYPYNNWISILIATQLLFYFSCIILSISWGNGYLLLGILVKYVSELFYAYRLNKILKFKWYLIFIIPVYLLYIPVLLIFKSTAKTSWKERNI